MDLENVFLQSNMFQIRSLTPSNSLEERRSFGPKFETDTRVKVSLSGRGTRFAKQFSNPHGVHLNWERGEKGFNSILRDPHVRRGAEGFNDPLMDDPVGLSWKSQRPTKMPTFILIHWTFLRFWRVRYVGFEGSHPSRFQKMPLFISRSSKRS